MQRVYKIFVFFLSPLIFLFFFSISCAGDSPSRYNGGIFNDKYPSRFRILIWPYGTDVLKDFDLYKTLKLGGFQIDRGAGQYRRIRLSVEKKFPFYAGHVADKGYLYLTGVNKKNVTGKAGLLKRPLSLADPNVIKEIKAHIKKNILDLKKGKVIAYALDDEISLTRGFLSAHNLCVHSYLFSKKKLQILYNEKSTLFLDDKEVDKLWKIMVEGL